MKNEMIKIKTPAVFLSFDDCHLKEWHETLPLFARYDARVTFYVSYIRDIDDTGWQLLGELREAGHTIAFHGLNHMRAGLTVAQENCEAYLARDIHTGLRIMKDNGFNNIRHFSYPYGNRTEESDRCLWKIFDTLRMGGVHYYMPRTILETRLIHSFSFGARSEHKFGHFKTGINKRAVVCTYMHRPKGKITPQMSHPMEYWLETILDYGRKHGTTFYPMEALDR